MEKIKPVIVVALICGILIVLDNFVIPYEFSRWGIMPRRIIGLRGIACAPFIHASFSHFLSNMGAFLVLGSLLFVTYPKRAIDVIILSILFTGIAVWIFGRGGSVHVGLSGVIYAIAAFLVFAGIYSKRALGVVVAIAVVVLYGGMVWGILPSRGFVSWESHLAGAIFGFVYARMFKDEAKALK